MHEIEIQTEIDAPAQRVWDVLTDFARYPEWNPLMRELTGELVVGRPLRVLLELGDGTRMTIKPTLLRFEPPLELCWRGQLLLPSLFAGEHGLVIEPIDDRRCLLIHAERFSGVLIPLFRRLAAEKTRQAFLAMNLALKARAEAGS